MLPAAHCRRVSGCAGPLLACVCRTPRLGGGGAAGGRSAPARRRRGEGMLGAGIHRRPRAEDVRPTLARRRFNRLRARSAHFARGGLAAPLGRLRRRSAPGRSRPEPAGWTTRPPGAPSGRSRRAAVRPRLQALRCRGAAAWPVYPHHPEHHRVELPTGLLRLEVLQRRPVLHGDLRRPRHLGCRNGDPRVPGLRLQPQERVRPPIDPLDHGPGDDSVPVGGGHHPQPKRRRTTSYLLRLRQTPTAKRRTTLARTT